MIARCVAAGLLACVLAQAPTAAAARPPAQKAAKAAAPKPYVAARTAFGQPSLEGVWAANFVLVMEASAKIPDLVAPEAEAKALGVATGEALITSFGPLDPEVGYEVRASEGLPRVRGQHRTRLVVEPADGKLPYTPEGRTESRSRPRGQTFDNPEERPDAERCLAAVGPPPVTSLVFANMLQVVQTRDHVVLHTEYGDEVRIVPFAAAHGPKVLRSALGDSIARWEGDTLVIETVGLPDKNRLRSFPTLVVPGDATVIERLTRVAKGELNYRFTVVAPTTYAAPWLGEFSWFSTEQRMYEHACHEGNYSLPGILAGARHDEAVAKAAAAATR